MLYRHVYINIQYKNTFIWLHNLVKKQKRSFLLFYCSLGTDLATWIYKPWTGSVVPLLLQRPKSRLPDVISVPPSCYWDASCMDILYLNCFSGYLDPGLNQFCCAGSGSTVPASRKFFTRTGSAVIATCISLRTNSAVLANWIALILNRFCSASNILN